MIPARIISISDKVMVEYWKPLPSFSTKKLGVEIRAIAEVENIVTETFFDYETQAICSVKIFRGDVLKVGMQVFIEPTSEGKAKIVKI